MSKGRFSVATIQRHLKRAKQFVLLLFIGVVAVPTAHGASLTVVATLTFVVFVVVIHVFHLDS